MKRRKLISYLDLIWRKHSKRIILVMRVFFWESFMILIPLIYGPLMAEVLHGPLPVGYLFCVAMVLIIHIALTDEFWNNP